jgi:hypothetical protein
MLAKRFIITLGLLIVSLFMLVTGVNAALDRVAKSPAQNSLVIYDDQGRPLFAYNGDLNDCTVSVRPSTSFVGPHFLHRT